MVDTENFLFFPVGLQCLLELPGAAQIFAKGFLNLWFWLDTDAEMGN